MEHVLGIMGSNSRPAVPNKSSLEKRHALTFSWARWLFACCRSRILLVSFVTSFSINFSAANCLITFTFTLRFTRSHVFHRLLCCHFALFLIDGTCFVVFHCFDAFLRGERCNHERIGTAAVVYEPWIVHVGFDCSSVGGRIIDRVNQHILVLNRLTTYLQAALLYLILMWWLQRNYWANTTIQSLGLLIKLIFILFEFIESFWDFADLKVIFTWRGWKLWLIVTVT